MSNPPDDDDLIPFDPDPNPDPDVAEPPAVAPDVAPPDAVPDGRGSPGEDARRTADPAADDRERHADDLGSTGPSEGGRSSDGGMSGGGALADGGTSDGGMRPDGGTSDGGTSRDANETRDGVKGGSAFGLSGEAEDGAEAKCGGASRSVAAGGSTGGAGRRGKRAALRKAALLGLVVAASIVAIGAGAYGVLKPYLAPDDFEGTGSGTVTVRIPPGANAGDIGAVLADAGVVASGRSFVNVTKERAVAGRLRPGHYRLRKGMAAGAALDLLLAPASRVIRRVTVPEGMRAGETFERVAAQSGLAVKELRAVDTALVGLPKYARGLEGFLFPATYEVEPGDKAVDLLAAMVERFRAAARKLKLVEKAPRVHLTPLEAVTVASMVQAEGGRDEDYPKISRVIYNRLQRGTPLQIDSTVLYAQGKRTLKVTESDTKVRSPYNTYAHTGLPPGPIANPGEKALIAALHPAKGDWHWFVTTDPAHRITKFTNKESEFVRYREELNRNLRTK
ncbi:endolytic transglycosylase MltG [Nonomuraea sp. NPDC026600]|uniref:endolytic transglycosylase MltG n=1 Tax=Nonomuraea sp. NPDC026600 TaxID=3155363 RepID=UPI0033F0CEC2